MKKQNSPSETQNQTETISEQKNPQNRPNYSSLNSIQQNEPDLKSLSQTQSAPINPKKRNFRMKSALIVLLVLILLIILYFPATMLVSRVMAIRKYNSAVNDCGKPPVVITFVGGFFGSVDRTYYLPEQQDYAAKKYPPVGFVFATSYDVEYVCNEADVAKKYPNQDIQKALTEQEQMAKAEAKISADESTMNKILDEYDKAGFSYFYPTPLPPGFTEDKKFRYSHFSTEDGIKVYSYNLSRRTMCSGAEIDDNLMIIEADSLDYKSPYAFPYLQPGWAYLVSEKGSHQITLRYTHQCSSENYENGQKTQADDQKWLEQVMTTLVPNRDRAVNSKIWPDDTPH